MDDLKTELLAAIAAASDPAALEAVRISALGKKGRVTDLLKTLGTLAPDERKTHGAEINLLKEAIEAALAARKEILDAAAMEARLASETLDVTLPVSARATGKIHPISQTIEEMIELFAAQGFTLAEGTDIEDEEHNFDALNIPASHPARQMHDTFYLPPGSNAEKWLLRTHTSPVQIRTMRAGPPPYRVIIPGRVYRSDYDATHAPMFHQCEGLVIDRDINMAHLRGCLETFLSQFFGITARLRFRPSFFPFTEPSAEVDVGCDRSDGEIKIGAGIDWLEILGCGMVHPNVLRAGGLDPAEWQGFAFGFGVDRLAMLKYGIPDLRPMFDGDIRWLDHYGFDPLAIPSRARGTL